MMESADPTLRSKSPDPRKLKKAEKILKKKKDSAGSQRPILKDGTETPKNRVRGAWFSASIWKVWLLSISKLKDLLKSVKGARASSEPARMSVAEADKILQSMATVLASFDSKSQLPFEMIGWMVVWNPISSLYIGSGQEGQRSSIFRHWKPWSGSHSTQVRLWHVSLSPWILDTFIRPCQDPSSESEEEGEKKSPDDAKNGGKDQVNQTKTEKKQPKKIADENSKKGTKDSDTEVKVPKTAKKGDVQKNAKKPEKNKKEDPKKIQKEKEHDKAQLKKKKGKEDVSDSSESEESSEDAQKEDSKEPSASSSWVPKPHYPKHDIRRWTKPGSIWVHLASNEKDKESEQEVEDESQKSDSEEDEGNEDEAEDSSEDEAEEESAGESAEEEDQSEEENEEDSSEESKDETSKAKVVQGERASKGEKRKKAEEKVSDDAKKHKTSAKEKEVKEEKKEKDKALRRMRKQRAWP